MPGTAHAISFVRTTVFAAVALLCAALCGRPALAHPHVWVTVTTTIVYENGTITGLRHNWSFDDAYTQMALEGLDKNGDGKYDREELAELAKINIEGLKEFDYFTFAKLGTQALKFGPPKDAWLDYTNKVLTLHFTLPLEQPVLADAPGFTFQVYDPTFFIAFDLANDNPIKLSEHAPQGCKTAVEVPKEDAAQQQSLSQAFSEQLGGAAANLGGSMAKTISVTCARS
jgi:ABC-type uncharacterized transport system substrate-binding protein